MPAAKTVDTPWVEACQLPKKPRRPAVAYSTMNAVDAPNSPPVEKPWIRRASRMSNGDATPICA